MATVETLPAGAVRTRDELRRLQRTSWPLIVGNFAQFMPTVVNTILLGHWSTDAMVSAAVASPVYLMAIMGITGLATSTQVIVARRAGEARLPAAAAAVHCALMLAAILSVLLGLVMVMVGRFASRALAPEASMSADVLTYLSVMSLALPFAGTTIILRAALNGLGYTGATLRVALLVNVTNLLADVVLIYGFKLGVLGSAIGTVMGVAAGAAYAWTQWRATDVSAQRAVFLLTRDEWRISAGPLVRIAVPEGLLLVLQQASTLLLLQIVAEIGVTAVGAYRVLSNVLLINWCVLWGCSTGFMVLAGHALGAGDGDRIRALQKAGLLLMAALSAVIATPLLVVPEPFMTLFTADPRLLAILPGLLPIVLLQIPLMIVNQVLGASLRAGGESRAVFMAATVADYAVQVPLTWLLVSHTDLGLAGAYVAALMYWVARLAITWRPYARARWRLSSAF